MTGDPLEDLTAGELYFGQLGGMPSADVRDLYLTGDGAGVARALGVPVHRSELVPYGTVLEDRTTGELRLIVGTRRTFADVLATVRREAAGITLTVLEGYGDPAYHARRRRTLEAEAFLETLAGQAVAEAR